MTARARRPAAHLAAVLLVLLALVPPTAAAASAPVVVGIVLREAGPAFAVLQDPATSRTGFYRVGDRVGDAVVKAILADRVILVTGDQPTQLRLAMSVSSDRGSASAAPLGPTASRVQRGGASGGAVVEPPPSPYGTIATVTAPAGPASWGGPADGAGRSVSPLAGGGQAGGPGAGAEGTQIGLGASLTITGHLHGGGSVPGDQFSTTSLRDLLIAMSYSNVTKPHRQRLELYAPDGSLYQRLTGAVAPSTQTLIPVGGTWITEHSLFGGWRVDVYVDRETTPIVSHPFTLTP